MVDTTPGRWVRLQDGGRFVGDLWLGSEERQRREVLIAAIWSGWVPMRARFTTNPHHEDGQPVVPPDVQLRHRLLGTITPLPNIEAILLRIDPRVLTWDITSSRVTFSVSDDRRLWGPLNWEPFFPGGATIATGRFLAVELDDIEFDAAVARAYIIENLLPGNTTAAGETMLSVESPSPASPQADGNAIPIPPYHTGLPGKPSSWHLLEAECRSRYEAGERHPNNRTNCESPTEWARVLLDWLAKAHAQAPKPTQKTLTNRLTGLLRELAATQRPES